MAETTDKTPEWMLRLENKKKRPHRLAHEIGAGAPCFSCGDACPGLDLHFWRKLCRNCKCKKEEHDVKDDEGYEQFEILLGAGGRKRKTGGVLKIKVPEEVKAVAVEPSNKGVAFDWVPPNVTEDVAAEYMRKLPAAKLPISGSDGALYRRQQLEKQVPLHDLDASKCHNLTPEEIEELTKYLENLKSNVVGQGCVTKVPVLYTESRLVMHGPHHQHSSSQVLGRPLASSQSADSIRTLPPIPPAYNSVPRPFQQSQSSGTGGEDDDFPPPPLPDSLPPNLDLKTPSAFIPSWTLPQQKPYDPQLQDGTRIAATGHAADIAYSAGIPSQLGSSSTIGLDPAARDGMLSHVQYGQSNFPGAQHGMIGHYAAPSGHILLKDGSNPQTLYSGNIPGQEAQFSAALGASGTLQRIPQDASLSALYHEQGLAHSSAMSGNPGAYSSPLHRKPGQGGDVIYSTIVPGQSVCEAQNGSGLLEGASDSTTSFPQNGVVSASLYPTGVLHSAALYGQAAPQLSAAWGNQGALDPKLEAISGSRYPKGFIQGQAIPAGTETTEILPLDGTIASSTYPKGMVHSSIHAGQSIPGMSSSLGHKGIPGKDGSVSGMKYSTGVQGQAVPGLSDALGHPGIVPREGTVSGIQHPSDVAYSSGVLGHSIPGMSAALGYQGISPQDGSLSGARYPSNVAHSGYVPGQGVPASSLGAAYPRAQQYSSMVGGVPDDGLVAAALPLDGVLTASLLPRGDLASSSAVGTDAMPKSAQVMQQSHPALEVEDLAGRMAQLSADGQAVAEGHLDCPECTQPICAGDVAVFAERAGNETAWHPQCFVCNTCKELLVDLIYFYNKGNVYCGRHFAELLNIPRCFACDELIFVKEYTVAEGKAFHVKHFCCYECDDPLAGKQYVPVDEQPVCLDCFDFKYGKKCHTCKLKIAAGDQRVGWKELNWHVQGDCFRCFECAKSLLGGRFVVKENQPFCSKECVQAAFAKMLAQ